MLTFVIADSSKDYFYKSFQHFITKDFLILDFIQETYFMKINGKYEKQGWQGNQRNAIIVN